MQIYPILPQVLYVWKCRQQKKGFSDKKVLSEHWVLQEKVGMKVPAFSLTKYFSFLGICSIIELSKDERR